MKTFHEWREVEEVGEVLPTFTTSDIGHFFVVCEEGEAMTSYQHTYQGGAITCKEFSPTLACGDFSHIWLVDTAPADNGEAPKGEERGEERPKALFLNFETEPPLPRGGPWGGQKGSARGQK